jgi:hypothetical protein
MSGECYSVSRGNELTLTGNRRGDRMPKNLKLKAARAEKDTENKEFWSPIIADPKFKEACSKIFKLQSGKHSEIEDDIDLNEIDDDAIDIPSIGDEDE